MKGTEMAASYIYLRQWKVQLSDVMETNSGKIKENITFSCDFEIIEETSKAAACNRGCTGYLSACRKKVYV